MKPGITAKSIIIWFVVVLGLYLAIFYAIEYANQRKGPWEVDFRGDGAGTPSIAIHQPKLHIADVKIIFAGEKGSQSNVARKVVFAEPVDTLPAKMPFGEVIYEDLRTLPGVVTFNFFGHEVELLPRVLIVNKKEIPWKSESILELSATNKLPQPPTPPRGRE